MRAKTTSADQWLDLISKDKLQTFQDNFAKASGASMIFLNLEGTPLTVWSQNSLFCFTIAKSHGNRCEKNFQSDMEEVRKGAPFVHSCPFGISCLYVPVYFKDKLVACAAVGGITTPGSTISESLMEKYHVTSLSKERISVLLQLLDSMLQLLNINISIAGQRRNDARALSMKVRDDRISKREREIVSLLCKGCSNRQIAQQLFISETTVKTHISNILAKLNLHDRMQIVVYYYNKDEN